MTSQPNQSLHDGLQVLGHLATAAEPQGCRPLARRMGMDAARMNRLLQGLLRSGYAQQDAQRRYYPGPAFQVLAAIALHASPLLRSADPLLRQLEERSGCAAALGMCWDETVVYLWHSGRPGASSVYPAAESSIGRLLQGQGQGRQSCRVRHGAHYSLAVPLPGSPNTALALTAIPLDAALAPLRAALVACGRAIHKAIQEAHHA